MVIDRWAGTVSIGPCPASTRSLSTATRRLPSCGRNRSTGSASPRRPSSHSSSPATPVTGLVIDAMREQRVERHRRASVRAEMADGFVEHQAPMPGDRDDRARQLASLDLGVQRGDDPGKPRRRHADRFRLRARQSALVCRGSGHFAPPGSTGVIPEPAASVSDGGGQVNRVTILLPARSLCAAGASATAATAPATSSLSEGHSRRRRRRSAPAG